MMKYLIMNKKLWDYYLKDNIYYMGIINHMRYAFINSEFRQSDILAIDGMVKI